MLYESLLPVSTTATAFSVPTSFRLKPSSNTDDNFRATHAFDNTMNPRSSLPHSLLRFQLTTVLFSCRSRDCRELSDSQKISDFKRQKPCPRKLSRKIHPRTYLILLVKKKHSNIYSSHSKLISSGNSLLQFIDTYRYTPYSSLQHFNTS